MLKTLSLLNPLSFNIQAAPARTSHRAFSGKSAYSKPLSPLRTGLIVGLAAVNFLLLMSYVAGVNNNASKGYEIKSLQSKISQLKEQEEQLNLKVSEASSMMQIQTNFLNSNFVAVGTANYLQLNQYSQR